MRHTPLLKEYLPITELSQRRYVWPHSGIRHKQSRPPTMTCSHTNKRDIGNKYTVTIGKKIDTLLEVFEKITPDDEYENYANAHMKATAECIPTKPKAKHRIPWETLAVRKNEIKWKQHSYVIKETQLTNTKRNKKDTFKIRSIK